MNSIEVSTPLVTNEDYKVHLTYETYGPVLGTAPIILVNHALTGNSTVTGKNGWWNQLIGKNRVIDTKKYSIIAFNIPGNGYDGLLIENYKDFSINTIAHIFLEGLKALGIHNIYAVLGSSLGGAIAWQMAFDQPSLFKNIIPIVTDYKTSNWVRGQSLLQDKILNHSSHPIEDARIHGMLLYRTPASLEIKFKNDWNQEKQVYKVTDWLNYHGNALKQRFSLQAYKLMNHLISTIDVTDDPTQLKKIKGNIHLVAVDTDLFFSADRMKQTYDALKPHKPNIFYHEIHSIHGHDAFLIEYDQLEAIIKNIIEK